jgi:cell fate regulator YaaT (PSP1 superfamily)
VTEVISVKFKSKGKAYYFDPNGITVAAGQNVVVDTSKGAEYAECVCGNHMVEDSTVLPPLRPLLRAATPEDDLRAEENRKKEVEAMTVCRERITKHGLDMKLVDVEYSFDGSKILFFFTAEGRVDFRDLVKDLAGLFRTRIELRQIGVRDEARMLGGLGICGRPFCCAGFLDDFQPVSIKMAKTQGLSLNPTKISGTCGRLMCCLKYEQEAYEELVKNVPKADSFVQTPAGKGAVIDVNLLRGRVKVRIDDQYDNPVKVFEAGEVEVLGGKAKRQEYLAAIESGEVQIQRPAPRLRSEPRSSRSVSVQPAVPAPGGEAPQSEEKRAGGKSRQDRPRGQRDENKAGQENRQENRQARPPRQGNRPRNENQKQPQEAARRENGENGPQRYRNPHRQNPPQNHIPQTAQSGAPAPGANARDGEERQHSNHHRRYRNHRGRGRGGDGAAPKSE